MKRWSVVFSLMLLLAALAPPTGAAADSPAIHVLLIDGSGSMENSEDSGQLYSSGNVQRLVQGLLSVAGAFHDEDAVIVGIFSKQDDRIAESPRWLLPGRTTVGALRAQWPKLEPLLGWTDLIGALNAGVDRIKDFKGPQLIWLLTDNIAMEADDQDSTDQWYAHLAGRAEIGRIYVFPVDAGARQGLVLYGMGRDRGASRQADYARLDRAVEAINASALRPKLENGGFLVRPLSEQGLTITISDFTADDDAEAATAFRWEAGRVVVSGFLEQRPLHGRFRVALTSPFPGLKIADAQIEAQLVSVESGDFALPAALTQQISPTKVSLGPRQTAEYLVELNIPPPAMAWNPLTGLSGAMAETGTVRATLQLLVTGITFAAVEPEKYFKVQQIPEILGNRGHLELAATTPVTLEVSLPDWRLWVMVLLWLGIVLLAGLALWAAFGQRRWLRVHGLHLDQRGLVSMRRRLLVPGLGSVRGGLFGSLIFVPEPPISGERRRYLSGRRGEVKLKGAGSFQYERVSRHDRTGGSKRASAGGIY